MVCPIYNRISGRSYRFFFLEKRKIIEISASGIRNAQVTFAENPQLKILKFKKINMDSLFYLDLSTVVNRTCQSRNGSLEIMFIVP